MGDAKDGRTGHVAGIGLLTLVLLWPALWSGAPTAFFDIDNYYHGGGDAVGFFLDRTGLDGLLGGGVPGEVVQEGPAGDGGGQSDGVSSNVRSVPYSVFVNVALRAVGPMAAVVPMTLVTAWLIWLMAAPLRPSARFAVGTGSALATTMPFYASQIMPDIQAAWLIAIPLVVMRRDGRPGPALSAALLLAAVAAILVHYSHIPLAAATGTILGIWFLARRRPGAALVAQLPLAVAVVINLGISVVIAGTGGGGSGSGGSAAEEPGGLSVVPGRVPVLLARLFEDGAAIRYLTETCPENGFTICEIYDNGFPDTSREVLWGENNVRFLATSAQMRRVTAEEMALAREVILYAPLAQIRAMARNTGDQFLRIGFSEMRLADYEALGPLEVAIDMRRAPSWLLGGLERVQAVSVSLSALALLALAWRIPAVRAPIVLLATGLLANAFVCGALSTPAGRYQGRIVWLVVTLALVCAPQWSIRKSAPPVRT